jgi:hypothetical protein
MMPQDSAIASRLHADGQLLFVYGTLRLGGSNDIRRFGPHSRLVGPARVQGRLHDLGPYPGMVLGGPAWVWGELHLIEPAIEPIGFDWRIGISIVSSFVAREVFVSSMATIYGAEIGIGTIDLIGALLLTQFIGIPFSLLFGRLPRKEEIVNWLKEAAN